MHRNFPRKFFLHKQAQDCIEDGLKHPMSNRFHYNHLVVFPNNLCHKSRLCFHLYNPLSQYIEMPRSHT